MSEWHISDVGTVSVTHPVFGVRLKDVGFDLGVTSSEARELSKALAEAADFLDTLRAVNA
jgi:hypothetical protein